MTPPDAHSPDALLEQVSWVRALAGTLIRDEAAAEDLTQETYVAALQRKPDDRRPLRGWLATVLRNLAVQHGRRDRSRSTRERAAARGEATPPTVDALARAEKQRRVAEMVIGLPEPYRTTVLLRFFDGLPPRKIAELMVAPVATVHSRLQRALQMLRQRIDPEPSGRRAWLSPLCVPVAARRPELLGAAVKLKTATCSAGVLMLALGGLWLMSGGEPPPQPPLQRAAAEPGVDPDSRGGEPAANQRRAVADEVETGTPQTGSPTVRARGRVLLVGGEPLANVRVGYRTEADQALRQHLRSDAGGRFELELREVVGQFEADDDRYATVMVAMARPESAGESVLLVAPRLDFSGRVVDESGGSIAGARVSVRSVRPTAGGVGVVLDASQPKGWDERTGSGGQFALTGTPHLSGALLEVVALGYRPHREELPAHSQSGLEVVLRRPDIERDGIRGVVLSPDGWLMAGALVSHGTATGVTDAGGQFQLPWRSDDRAAPVLAVKPGFQPASLPAQNEFREDLVLQLGPPPLKITGVVVDAEGQPMDDVKVWLAEPTYFGVIDRAPLWLEGLSLTLEPEFWTPATTDTEGGFEIPGVAPRPYRLRAVQMQTLLETEVEDVLGGTEELTITMPTDQLLEELPGQVVSMAGRPLPRITVMHYTETLRKDPENGWTATSAEPGATTVSDAEGRFGFRNVPAHAITLMAMGEDVIPRQFKLEAGDLLGGLELILEQQLHLQIELGSAGRADAVRVLDSANAPMQMYLMRAQRGQVNFSWPIVDGQSPVITVGETAAFAELLQGGQRIALIPLALSEGEVNVIRY